jgi:hypothetical protein
MRVRVLKFPDSARQFDIGIAVVRDGGMMGRQIDVCDAGNTCAQKRGQHCLHNILPSTAG